LADDDDEVAPAADDKDESAAAIGNRTMQVDALVEELEEGVAVPHDALAQILADARGAERPQTSMPPPLPPKKVGAGTIVAGVVIVLLAAGGGIFFGMKFMGAPPAPVAAPVTPEPPVENVVEGDEEPVELEAIPIQLEEVAIPHPDDEVLEDDPETVDEE
jgi:hypothetical protein